MYRPRRRAGYTMVALMIWVTIMGILIAAVGPVWSHFGRREREAELIFRGGQYVEAIRIFQKRTGRMPMNLEELVKVEPRSIRKLYKDPITDTDDWGLCFQGGICQDNFQVGGNPTPTNPPGGGEGGKDDRGEDESKGPGQDRPREDSPGGSFNPTGPGQTVSTGPIIGVYSKSNERSIKIYKGRQKYSEWKFTILDLQATPQPGGGGPGGPGGPGGGAGPPVDTGGGGKG